MMCHKHKASSWQVLGKCLQTAETLTFFERRVPDSVRTDCFQPAPHMRICTQATAQTHGILEMRACARRACQTYATWTRCCCA
jgi:hypothetical protein